MHLAKAYPADRGEMGDLRRREPDAGRGGAPLGRGFPGRNRTSRARSSSHGFRDGFLPFQGELVKETFEELKSNFVPDLILTHHDDDRHQDHRLVSQLTWNTWRDHMILEYEIMKYDGDLGRPNLYVPLSEDVCRNKIAGLFEAFPVASQAAVVQRGDVLVAAEAARRRVQCAVAPRRSILRAEDPRLAVGDSPRWYHRLQTKAVCPSPLRVSR